jgi:hypothetical protein
VKVEVRFDGIVWRGGDERLHRRSHGFATGRVDAGGRQRRGLTLDADAEVDHVEHVVMGANGRGLDRERRRLWHREHERATALEGFDEALGP